MIIYVDFFFMFTGLVFEWLTMLSLEILATSDFDKIAGTAIYYLQCYYMSFLRIIMKVAGGSHGSNRRYRRLPALVDNTGLMPNDPQQKMVACDIRPLTNCPLGDGAVISKV